MSRKIKSYFSLRTVTAAVAASLLMSCGGNGEDGELAEIEGLRVSLNDYRYGVQNVSSVTSQQFTVSNVGVDTYPISSISLGGENPEDFLFERPEAVTLEPGEELEIDVAFSPLSGGQRTAKLNIQYDTIIGIGSNFIEAIYYDGRDAERAGDYVSASQAYRDYLNAGATTSNRERAVLKVPLLEEADVYGTGSDFGLYQSALNKRDEGNSGAALQLIDALLRQHDDSYLVDDAKYLRAYIQMADFGDFQLAYDQFQLLIDEHPESTYIDTAIYSQGLAQHELGNIEKAEEIFISLRDRHTGIKLGLFELRWPKDNFVSRLWFDESEEQLQELRTEETNANERTVG